MAEIKQRGEAIKSVRDIMSETCIMVFGRFCGVFGGAGFLPSTRVLPWMKLAPEMCAEIQIDAGRH